MGSEGPNVINLVGIARTRRVWLMASVLKDASQDITASTAKEFVITVVMTGAVTIKLAIVYTAVFPAFTGLCVVKPVVIVPATHLVMKKANVNMDVKQDLKGKPVK
uniref:Uncharacterized protein n=1 Tax=Biomphalaria glabrata TaxID=6526 RepID=A0A2C9KPK4_BIOGL